MPTPVRGTVCGLLGSPSKNERTAEASPNVVGVKLRLTLQLVFAARVAPQADTNANSEAVGPEREGGAEKLKSAEELFVMVATCDWLVWFNSCCPKSNETGLTTMTELTANLATNASPAPLGAR